jgi:ABC-type phosphate/phosphonate transport system substrate-binding protein
MVAILAGRIDVAAVDAVTFALFGRCRPERAVGLRALGFTQAVPGCPLITNRSVSPSDLERLRSALAWLFQAPETSALRARLMLSGISFPSANDYQVIAMQEQRAAELGYPELR